MPVAANVYLQEKLYLLSVLSALSFFYLTLVTTAALGNPVVPDVYI